MSNYFIDHRIFNIYFFILLLVTVYMVILFRVNYFFFLFFFFYRIPRVISLSYDLQRVTFLTTTRSVKSFIVSVNLENNRICFGILLSRVISILITFKLHRSITLTFNRS